VALRLGSLAAILERPQAADHFERALEMNVRMRARPWLARTQYEYARMLLASGGAEDEQRAAALLADALATARELDMPLLQERVLGVGGPVSAPPDSAGASGAGARISTPIPDTRSPTPDSVFCREGDYWTIAYAGKVVRLKDSKGVQYLAHLLGHPGQEFLALDLVQGLGVSAQGAAGNGAGTGTQGAWAADPGLPALDAQARREYRQRLAELRDELSEAEQFNDLARATKLRLEIELLGQQLAAALDLHGRDRKAGAASERGRLMVTKRIKSVLKTLDRLHPPLAHHLRACVKTGYCCVYTPPPGQPVVWHT
jgi:tetratricopeptide (TPR) repeat protein